DTGLRHLAGLTQLGYLNVGGTRVTDAGLKELAGLTQMRMFCLYDTAVTDAGMKDLLHFPRLERLLIGNTAVTDARLKQPAPLRQLRAIDRNVTSSGEGPNKVPPPPDAAAQDARLLQRLRAEAGALQQRDALQARPADAVRPAGGKGWATAGLLFL